MKVDRENRSIASFYKNITGQEIKSPQEMARITRVLENASLSNEDRISAALKLSSIQHLTDQQKIAIELAHNTGESGLFRYSTSELREKAKILREAGLNQNQIDELMREGITGQMNNLDKELLEYAQKIKSSNHMYGYDHFESALRATEKPKLLKDLSDFKKIAEAKHLNAINSIYNKFLNITYRAENPKHPNYIPSEKIERLYMAIKKQIGDEGNIRAVDYDRFKETLDLGIVPAGSYFSGTDLGAHVGHNHGFIFIKCKRSCKNSFESSDTGSGMQNIRNMNLDNFELIIPDLEKAAREAGISLLN